MRYRAAATLVLTVATLVVYWPVHNYDFVWDDHFNVFKNPYLTPFSTENLSHIWLEPYVTMYIPFTYTVWMALAWLSQSITAESADSLLNPYIFHTFNIILHIINVLLVFAILRTALRHGFEEIRPKTEIENISGIEFSASVGALLFALHPLQVEPVAWVTGMKDLLYGLMSLLAIMWYISYSVAAKNPGAAAGKKVFYYILALTAFIFALLAKPTAVVVPLVLLVLDRWVINRPLRDSAVALGGWFVLSGALAVIAKSVQQDGYPVLSTPLWTRPFIAGDALAFYLYKLILPFQQAIDYGRASAYVIQQWWIYVTWFLPVLLGIGIWFTRKRAPWLASMGIFVIFLAPVLGFVPFNFQFYSTVADRYLYLSMLGAALSISWICYHYQKTVVRVVCVAAVVLLGLRTSYQVPVWENKTTLYTSALRANPSSFLSHYNLGVELEDQGKLNEAVKNYEKAVEINPRYVKAYYNLGNSLSDLGKLDAAVTNYEKAIEHNPGHVKAYYNLGITLAEQRKLEEAVNSFRQTIKIKPDHLEAHINLGVILSAQNRLQDAVAHFREALRINPDYAKTNEQLGLALLKQNQLEEAVHHLTNAVKIKPNYAQAYYYLGIAYRKQGDLTKAVRHFGKALAMRPGFKQAKKQLEMAILQSRGDKH